MEDIRQTRLIMNKNKKEREEFEKKIDDLCIYADGEGLVSLSLIEGDDKDEFWKAFNQALTQAKQEMLEEVRVIHNVYKDNEHDLAVEIGRYIKNKS